MYGKVKLSKRQIKEDKFTAFMLKAKSQIVDNWQFYAIGIVAVVLVIVASTYYFQTQTQQAQAAAAKYARAALDVRGGNTQVAILSLEQILEEDRDDVITKQATFLLGNIHYSQKQYDEARRYWETYLAKYKKETLYRAAALAGIAACYENQAQFSEAADYFLKAVEEYPDGPMAADYHLGAMRNYLELGQTDQAKQQLEVIQEDFGDGEIARQAELLFAESTQG
jgi:outer membrane protein assembly factor BamD (BamD/ComL family)